jgi:heme exporter protein D
MSWTEFLNMGNYGFYVWTSYALAAIVLALNVLVPLRQRKTVRQRLQEFYRLQRQSR